MQVPILTLAPTCLCVSRTLSLTVIISDRYHLSPASTVVPLSGVRKNSKWLVLFTLQVNTDPKPLLSIGTHSPNRFARALPCGLASQRPKNTPLRTRFVVLFCFTWSIDTKPIFFFRKPFLIDSEQWIQSTPFTFRVLTFIIPTMDKDRAVLYVNLTSVAVVVIVWIPASLMISGTCCPSSQY